MLTFIVVDQGRWICSGRMSPPASEGTRSTGVTGIQGPNDKGKGTNYIFRENGFPRVVPPDRNSQEPQALIFAPASRSPGVALSVTSPAVHSMFCRAG